MLAGRKRLLVMVGTSLAIAALIAGCTTGGGGGNTGPTNNSDNGANGKQITIGFSGPAADHGWLGAINAGAIAEAAKYKDVKLVVAEGTNDANLQISQVETFINDKVDAIVLLPTDGAALTEVAIKAMKAGIPVINVDREFSSTFAARVTILGDNYGAPPAACPLTSTSPPTLRHQSPLPSARPASAIAQAFTMPLRSSAPSGRCGVNAPPVSPRQPSAVAYTSRSSELASRSSSAPSATCRSSESGRYRLKR